MLQAQDSGGGKSTGVRRTSMPRPEPRPKTQPSPLQKKVPEDFFQQKEPLEVKKPGPQSRGTTRDMIRNFVAQRDIKENAKRPSLFGCGGTREQDILPYQKVTPPLDVRTAKPRGPQEEIPQPTSLGMMAELAGIHAVPRPAELDSKDITNERWLKIYKAYNAKVMAAQEKALKKLGKT
jgi:hypothetical protein